MPTLLAACVVTTLRADAGTIGVTAIDKQPVEGRVKVGPYGLYADVQADRKHHGGLDKAVYAYSQEDADFWAAELGQDIPAGWFGENLRVSGVDINAARAGERWVVGDAELEVTTPRFPCQTFARWVGGEHERGWVKRFTEVGRAGTYLRVIKAGKISSGDTLEITYVPEGAPTVLDLFRS